MILKLGNVCNKALLNVAANSSLGGLMKTTLHISTRLKNPQVVALNLPTNVIDINAAEMGRFSPQRERDITGPVLNTYHKQKIDITTQVFDITPQFDPHVSKYDCQGAVSLSSSMQSNVPSPFSGCDSHLSMPGSQWGQGYKYLSDHLQGAHYLTLRNEYKKIKTAGIIERSMSTDTNQTMSAKEKLKRAVKEYGSTVIVFHVGISLLSLGGCYLLISSGVDLVKILSYLNIGEGTTTKLVTSNAGTFVVAYAVHKLLAPFRIAITLTATPFIVRYLRRAGLIKRTNNKNNNTPNDNNTPGDGK